MDTIALEPVGDLESFADETRNPELVLCGQSRGVAGGLSGGPIPRQQRVQLA